MATVFYEDFVRKTKELILGMPMESHEIALVFEFEEARSSIETEVRKRIFDFVDLLRSGYPCHVEALATGPRWFVDQFGSVVLDVSCSDLRLVFNLTFARGQNVVRSGHSLPKTLSLEASDTLASLSQQVKIGSQTIRMCDVNWRGSHRPPSVLDAYMVSQISESARRDAGTFLLRVRTSLEDMSGVVARTFADDLEAEIQSCMEQFVPGVLRRADPVRVVVKLEISGEIPETTSWMFREGMRGFISGIRSPPATSDTMEAMVMDLSLPAPDSIKFTCGGKAFYVSKARVLEGGDSFSPVIKGCFDNPRNLESCSATYPIDDFDADIVEQFMVFLQCGATPDMKQARNLAYIADKYQVANLLKILEPYLVKEAAEAALWMDTEGQGDGLFSAFLELCKLAGVVYLPVLLTCLHYLLMDFEKKLPQWTIRDEWRAFQSSTYGMDFLERRLKAVEEVKAMTL